MPFSYTAYINTHWTTLVGILGAVALLLPLTRALPALYVWLIRRRLTYWYRQLKTLERNLDSGGAKYDAGALQAEFERIDSGRPAHPRAAVLFRQALRLARAHRSDPPASGDAAHADPDGCRVAR